MKNLKTQIHKEFDERLDKIMLPKNDLELHDKIQTLMWELIDKAIAEERERIIEKLEGREVEVPILCRNVPSQIAHEKALSYNQAIDDIIKPLKTLTRE